jgi:hypothetical protein
MTKRLRLVRDRDSGRSLHASGQPRAVDVKWWPLPLRVRTRFAAEGV